MQTITGPAARGVRAARRFGTFSAAATVPVRVDRFQHDRHIYTIKRRAQGTEWIWRGLELTQ